MQQNNRILRKVIWTAIAAPMLYKTWWAYGWQMERKKWKEGLIAERTEKLKQETLLISIDDIPFGTLPKEEFDAKGL